MQAIAVNDALFLNDLANIMNLSGAEKDTLICLVESGPLWDGDVPSKHGRDLLLEKGLAVKIVVNGEDGWQAATYLGREAYKEMFPGPDGLADTIRQAKVNRLTKKVISKVSN